LRGPVNEEEPSEGELKLMVQPPPVAPAVSIRKAFQQFWPYTRGLCRLFVVGVLFAIVAAVCEVASIGLFGFITDEVLSRQSLEAFWVPALAWLALPSRRWRHAAGPAPHARLEADT
jgi:ABC-type bacteriocin/lantibiotic exporter with double-glycine peptidase domain